MSRYQRAHLTMGAFLLGLDERLGSLWYEATDNEAQAIERQIQNESQHDRHLSRLPTYGSKALARARLVYWTAHYLNAAPVKKLLTGSGRQAAALAARAIDRLAMESPYFAKSCAFLRWKKLDNLELFRQEEKRDP